MDTLVGPGSVQVPMNPVMEKIFTYKANENVKTPRGEIGQRQAVIHVEVLCKGEGYLCEGHIWFTNTYVLLLYPSLPSFSLS